MVVFRGSPGSYVCGFSFYNLFAHNTVQYNTVTQNIIQDSIPHYTTITNITALCFTVEYSTPCTVGPESVRLLLGWEGQVLGTGHLLDTEVMD